MKILVSIKRVPDPDHADQVTVVAGHVDMTGVAWKPNPFDEAALEAALRLTENAKAPKARLGEVIAVTLGPAEADGPLRAALAIGANRAIRIEAEDAMLDGGLVARALRTIVEEERPDLVLMGSQTVDGGGHCVGQALASLLDWPMVASVASLHDGGAWLEVRRERDGCGCTMRVGLPAVVGVDLRVVSPGGVISKNTPSDYSYYDGVRFAALTAILQAKKKPLLTRSFANVVGGARAKAVATRFAPAPVRPAGVVAKDARTLVEMLAREARVL